MHCLSDCILVIIICERRKYLKSSAFLPDQLLLASSRKDARKNITVSRVMYEFELSGYHSFKVAVVGSEKTGCESCRTPSFWLKYAHFLLRIK